MTSFLGKFFGGKPAPKAAAKAAPAAKPKSADRLANEAKILEARRQILANMARIEQHPSAKQKVLQQIDQDADRASQVVRNILLSEGRK
jgi:HD superfamily phosphodiesterase